MYPVLRMDDLLPGQECPFGRITHREQARKLIPFGRMDDFLYLSRLIPTGIWNTAPRPSAAAASSMFSTAHQAEAK